MSFQRSEPTEVYGTLSIENEKIIQWFQGLTTEEQDEWVQAVEGRETAVVEGYSRSADETGMSMDIDYVYLSW